MWHFQYYIQRLWLLSWMHKLSRSFNRMQMFYFLTIIIKKSLTKPFRNGILIICKFSDHDINKFILLLRKRCLPIWLYRWLEFIWSKFITSKKDSYSYINMKDVTNADFADVKRLCNDFKAKMLWEHDLHVQSNTLLLSDVFENFRNMCIKIYKLGPRCFLFAPGLASKAALKNSQVSLDILTDMDMLVIV